MSYSFVRYTGNGSTTNYTFPFPYLSQDHVKVRLNGVLTTNFSFLNANTIQLFTAPSAGVVIDIRRETPKNTPIVNFTDGSVLLERDLDLLATYDLYIAQETDDSLSSSIQEDTQGRFDAESKRIINVADPVDNQDAVTKNYLDNNLGDLAQPYLDTAAASASAAHTSELAAASSAASALASKNAAAVSETNAADSAVSAANSAAAAATALDNFDDRYLGQKASDPTVDNDGNPLIQGALYFNTTNKIMRVYDGSGWLDASSAAPATIHTFDYVATAGQTVFSGADANGSVLSFTAPYLIVSLNGLQLRPTVDYTTTGSTTVTLTSAAALNDELQIISFKSFEVANVPAANVQFQQTGTGAVLRNADVKLKEFVSVKDFGAVGDGTTNDSPAFNAAILKAALAGGGRVIAPYSSYKLAGTIIIPSNVELDLCSSTIVGPGVGSATDLFQSGNLSGGSVVTNIGTANESSLVTHAAVRNATINNCGKAFNLFNWIDNCAVENIEFNDCTYAIYSKRSWYSRYINLFSRGAAGGATNATFYFSSFVNVQQIESVFAEGRALGIEIAGGANGLTLIHCSAENCTNGIKVSSETGPIKFDSCYLEAISGVAIDCNNGAGYKHNVTVENCWFQGCGTGIKTDKSSGASLYVSENCRFLSVTNPVDIGDDYHNFGLVEIPPVSISNNGYPSLPSGYTIGGKSRVNHENIIYDSGSGLGLIKTKVHGPALIAFEHEGNAGSPRSGTVSFCQNSKSAGTSFSIYVDTKIAYSQFSAFLVYRFSIFDNNGTYQLYGQVFGDQVKPGDATEKTVAVSNNGGYVRLTLSTFSHPSEYYGITGVVRHM